MTRRRSITAAQMRDILIAQAAAAGHPIPCPLCPEPILPGQRTVREHLHAIGLGGADAPENERLVHFECADRKTRGTKATSAGSDVHAMAKHRRLTGKNKPRPKRKVAQPTKPWAERWPQSQFVRRPGKDAERRGK